MKYVVCLLFIASLFFSCNRKAKQYVLKGRLVSSCDGSPGANQLLRIRQSAKSSGLGGSTRNKTKIDETITTNANGEFELMYETNHTAELEIDIHSQETNSMFSLPVANLDLGDILYNGKAFVYYKIKVITPYTNMDTLVYSDINSYPGFQMIGPFRDTVLGVRAINGNYNLAYNRSLKKVEKMSSDISISSNYRIKHHSMSPVYTYSTFASCGTVPDTFIVTIR